MADTVNYEGLVKMLLGEVAWAVMGTDGGATGPLFGSFFMGMSDGAGEGENLDCVGLASMFEAGLECVCKRTKAQVGDKTIMDAMIPAVKEVHVAALYRLYDVRSRCFASMYLAGSR